MERARERAREKALMVVNFDRCQYSIRATIHAQIRMRQRNVDPYTVCGSIISLGPDKIKMHQENRDEVMIIDEDKNIAVVIAFNKNQIKIVTVIDKASVYIRTGTSVEKLAV